MSTVVTLGSVILVLVFFAMLFFSHCRLRTIGIALAGVAVAYLGLVVWFSYALEKASERRSGPKHVFSIGGQTQFLEDAVALEKARQTLLLDGFTNGFWEPARDDRTVAPDGRADVYLVRNTQNPKRGVLIFTNAHGARSILVLEIEGTNLVCQRVAGK